MKSTAPLAARHKIAVRYALALAGCAQEKKSFDFVYNDLSIIWQGIEDSPEFASFLQDSEIPFPKFKTVLEALFKNKLNPLTWQFLDFLKRQDRLNILKEICIEFEKLYQTDKEILKVKIISAQTFKIDQLNSIADRLKSRFKKDIEYDVEINPELIGGFKVQVEDSIYDFSIQNQLDKFKQCVLNS